MKRYINDILTKILTLTLLLLAGANVAWGQTDLSGVYYIGSKDWKLANTTTNYYLCPTEGWCYYKATNDFTSTDNGQPFLTTYQCRNGVYEANKAVWIIEKHPSEDYYYIKHAIDGKYLIFNGQIRTTSNSDRMRVHLESMTSLGDNALFSITANGTGYNIKPKDFAKHLTVNDGNKPALTGQSGKTGGPTGYQNTSGIVGTYEQITVTSYFYLEETVMFPTFNIDASGAVSISSVEGTSIRYTTDGTTNPTASSGESYNGAITPAEGMTAIKAIAVRESDNKVSAVVTLPLADYTYNIVDTHGNIAIKHTVKQAVGKALNNYMDIPTAIRSPYLADETISFYSFNEAYTSATQLDDENEITKTPADPGNIYVTYTTDHLTEKFLHLTEASAYNMMVNSNYIYDNSGTLAYESAPLTTKNYMWQMIGGDPYAVQIKNADAGNYLHYSPIDLSNSASNFILMACSTADDDSYVQMELMAASGNDSYYRIEQVRAYPIGFVVNYYLIDKAGKLIEGPINSTAEELSLPDEWKSPLVSEYHYFKTPGLSDGTYTPSDPVSNIFDVESGGNIYVTYDVSDAIDLTGGKTYMLKFSDGVSFNQEDGKDGIEGTATKAIYPYNNGDFNLYVYGQAQWEKQLGDGSSTRTRWLWKILSSYNGTLLTDNNRDPYHVIFKSNQNHTIKALKNNDNYNYPGNSYLQTYKPDDYGLVVTGVAYENKEYYQDYGGTISMPASMVNGAPTEYMILGTSLQNMTLKTFNKVDVNGDGDTIDEEDERIVVNSFEQYWKNNPTVKDLAGEDPAADNSTLTGKGWHQYTAWAYSAPWGDNTKSLASGKHWFQTISMGSGDFTLEEVSLEPMVILLDQHGWEIMRVPLSNTETLRKYDSPMVENYHWYPKAVKATGYHKYTISDPAPEITVYTYGPNPNNKNKEEWYATDASFSYTSTSLSDSPYGHFVEKGYMEQPDKVKTDFYVTYDVKPEYKNSYTGAAKKEDTATTPFLLKQGGSYATTADGTTITTTTVPASLENATEELQWNLRPNFDIDHEMGYKYAGESGAYSDAKSKNETEADYLANGQNGFDPYNLQIQNKKYPLRYFTTDTRGSALSNGAWTSTSGATVTLQNQSTKQTATGYDQTTLNITNATFMVVDDGNGNMRLMPRFDHQNVVTSFTTLATQAAAATAGDNGAGTQSLATTSTPRLIHSTSEITSLGGHYILAENFTISNGFTSLGSSTAPFTGSIDGQLNTITGLSVPLVAYAQNAIIKNVILKEVSINQAGPVGAIACTATGTTRIYNCGILPTEIDNATNRSTVVSTDDDCGSLVGYLDGYARVINCFSYADVSAGTDDGKNAGGLVGNNTTATMQGNSQTDFNNNVKTMVVNCMFYGDIKAGATKRPVYGGTAIVNNASDKVNNYNYYCEEEASFDDNYSAITDYNYSWPVAKKYLTRFEVYRNILNTNRRLCTWWVSGSYSKDSAAPTDAEVEKVDIAKWVLDLSIAPYPILKKWGKYYSTFDIDPDYVWNPQTKTMVARTSANAWEGKSYNTLSVTINGGSNNSGATAIRDITITDIDTLGYDYCAKKIQLPYYNEIFGNPEGATWEEKYGNNYTAKVVTGWKVTAVDKPGNNSFTANWETGYNFADRKCTDKDIFETSGRVFAQGGYYYVPDGVGAITIEAYWGDAVYLCNPNRCLDRVNNGSSDFYISGKLPDKVNNIEVKTSLSAAVSALTVQPTKTVYDQAIVLVGNYQDYAFHSNVVLKGSEYDSKAKPFTIMSADFDFDNEPDFCFQAGMKMSTGGRINVQPIRFDFLMVPDITMAIRADKNYYGMRIWCPQSHFEITETSYMYTTQFEYDKRNANDYAKHDAPMILNGGEHMQIVSSESFGEATANETATSRVDATTYFLMGGKVYMKAFTPGCHGNKKIGTRHCAVNAIGGEFPEFYLSGMFRSDFFNMTDNPHAYLDGGKFDVVAGAGMESVGGKGETNGGNVTFKINNSWIDEFYGGGINASRPVTGNISITCDNSVVHKYCGGPKLGDMSSSKTITNNATNTVFDQFFGGGYGGTNNERVRIKDSGGRTTAPTNSNKTTAWNGDYGFQNFNAPRYTEGGYETEFEFEMLPYTSGSADVVKRTYHYIASFSKTTVAPVINTMTDCTFNVNFYGGGNLGAVGGDANATNVKSTLLGHTVVKGSAFGAGFSASIPSFKVHDRATVVYPYQDDSGFLHEGKLDYGSTKYTWIHDIPDEWNKTPDVSQNKDLIFEDPDVSGKWYVYTTIPLTGLGTVSGNVELIIKGTSEVKGNVYGGGDASAVSGSATVTLKESAHVYGDVFGGGNRGAVNGSATVNIEQ